MKATGLAIMVAMSCSWSANAAVLYEDNFENNGGNLHNRRPDAWDPAFGSLAYWKNEALNLVVTNGVSQTMASTGQQSAWLPLPDINSGDVIRVSAVVVANGNANTDWLGIGLLQSKSHVHQRGEPYVTLTRRPDNAALGASQGFLSIYGGLGNTNLLVSKPWLIEQHGFTTNLNARNTVGFEYDTATGNLLVWLAGEGGSTVTQYNGSVNYNGVEGQAVPIDELNYFGITFNSLNDVGNGNPAYLDDLVVERIPYVPGIALYEDKFENNGGDLHNRRPDSFDDSVSSLAWWKNEAQDLVVTNGVMQTTTNNGQQSAWLELPMIALGDVIQVSAVVVANGDANTDWLGLGLLKSKDGTFEAGAPYATLTRRAADPGANMGLLRIHGGLGNTNELATVNYLKEPQGFTTNLNARNTLGLEYDTASGNLQVWLTSEGGTTVTQYNGSANYNGVAGQPVPIAQLNYVGVTFNNLNALDGSNPAYIDDLVVRLVPALLDIDPYDAWAESFGGTNVIGAQTTDYDGDGLSNLYEYGLGGDPTNSADRGMEPTFSNADGVLRYIHVQRQSDTNLAYYLETTTSLVYGPWSNANYSVAGTNITGSMFNYVTNAVDGDANERFIRLVIER